MIIIVKDRKNLEKVVVIKEVATQGHLFNYRREFNDIKDALKYINRKGGSGGLY